MCGIVGILGLQRSKAETEQIIRQCTAKLYHRGPDDTRTFVSDDAWCALGFSRLAICDPEHGAQPMHNEDNSVWAVTNGEIYNHEQLRTKELQHVPLHTHSDCEVIAPMYEKHATSLYPYAINYLYNALKGVFASLVVDLARNQFVAARDPIGVRAMFLGHGENGSLWIASEAKAILDHCHHIEPFLPGCYYAASRGAETASSFQRYYTPIYSCPGWLPTLRVDLHKLHDSFVLACKRRLMSDVPVGVFISGGLDSSLVASVAKKHLPPDYVFHSFSCGLEGSPDVKAAQRVADYLGTEHHVLTFTVEDGINALKDVVYHLETYDVTTIRASTPMYMLSELCKKYVKVVLSGEGADEVFGGYLYFHNADSEQAFHEECVRRVRLLYTADVLRGDRATAAQSLELRVPFLDCDFLDVAMSFSAKDKITNKGKRIEKLPIRQAFTAEYSGQEYLPDDILMRPKEQFSDGVGYNWIDGLKDFCERQISDSELSKAAERFPHDSPKSKEAYYYRVLFEENFGKQKGVKGLRESVVNWVPMWSDSDDPSGRAQKFHSAAYSKMANGEQK